MAKGRNNTQTLSDFIFAVPLLIYQFLQRILNVILSPTPPKPSDELRRPKIAVIGAGLTGVSAASHCVGHGFDVHIFEKGPRKQLGGIWAKVNNTSGLQINSLMYRFHPRVNWSEGYPNRNEIVENVEGLWKDYGLEGKTSFDFEVKNTYKDKQGRWIINDESNGRFDGIIAAIGTCGDPKMPHMKGQDKFKGEMYHSSELDGKSAKGKKVAIIGGGASAVEALEFVEREQAEHTSVLARSEKWIIPRNAVIDMLLALNIFGQETFLSWIPENLLRLFFYRDLADISPPKNSSKGIFTETPMVNSKVLDLVRQGKAEWVRGDTIRLEENGVVFNKRKQGVDKGGPGRQVLIEADIIIMATGYTRPSLSFLPEEHFEEPYAPPAWYLQVFPPDDPTICCNNCTYVNSIGTVGNWHIGIYTRFLLMFLVDPLARPHPWWMKRWIDMTSFLKRAAPTGAFDFFTYSELVYWFTFAILINPFRWKWIVFVMFGIGASLPLAVVKREDELREKYGPLHEKVSKEAEEKVHKRVNGHKQ